MKLRKQTALLLTAAMAASILTGCGGGEKNSSETTKNDAPAASGEVVSSEDFFPLKEEINVTIAGVREDGFVPFDQCNMFKELEKQTNVKVKWLDWPQSQQKEKRNLAFASGTLPDAFYGSWSLDKPDVVKYGAEGMLFRFNDYLNETYMPNFTRILEACPELLNALSTPEGDVYALPTLNQNGLPKTNDTLMINTEWLKKVNKEMPTTTDELFDVLMAFKEAGDLNGNGKDDEVPLTFKYGENNTGMMSLLGFTGIVSNSKLSRMAMKDGQPVFAPATDEYKEYLTFLNKLYSNGLLDREAFTMDNPAYNAKTQTSTPVAGVLSGWSAELVNRPIAGNDPTKEGVYAYLAPVKGDNGKEPVWGMRVNALNANLSFAISADSEYAEELVRWIDLAYAKEASVENYLGKIGVHIQKEEGEGNYSKIMNAEGKEFSNDEKSVEVPNKFAVAWILEGDANFVDVIDSPQNKDAADAFYEPYLEENYVNDYVMMTEEENERIAFLATDLISYVDQMSAKFITEGNIDAGWDAYISQLKNLGLDEYVEIKTQIHNRATQK